MRLAHFVKSETSSRLPWIWSVYLIACLGIAMGTGAAAWADLKRTGPIPFDIPSQPLSTALEIYARLSGREVLYDGDLAVGHRSSTIDGVYTPVEALRSLLIGTGLSAQFKDADFFVLTAMPPAERQSQAVEAYQPTPQTRYYGRLQARLRAAFCGKEDVLPGNYRLAARLWIGPSGEVQQERRLASTGNTQRDNEVDETLRGLNLEGAPPVGVPQPITIVIMPDAPGIHQDCAAGNAPQPSPEAGP